MINNESTNWTEEHTQNELHIANPKVTVTVIELPWMMSVILPTKNSLTPRGLELLRVWDKPFHSAWFYGFSIIWVSFVELRLRYSSTRQINFTETISWRITKSHLGLNIFSIHFNMVVPQTQHIKAFLWLCKHDQRSSSISYKACYHYIWQHLECVRSALRFLSSIVL